MLLRPNNGGMAEGMACNGVMARGMVEWQMAGSMGMVKWREWREWQNGGMAEWGMVQWRESRE